MTLNLCIVVLEIGAGLLFGVILFSLQQLSQQISLTTGSWKLEKFCKCFIAPRTE